MTYKALKGIEVAGVPYVTGDLVHELADDAAAWLLERGAVEPVTDETPAPKASKKKGA